MAIGRIVSIHIGTEKSYDVWQEVSSWEECEAVYIPANGPAVKIRRNTKVTPLQKRFQELLPIVQAGAEGKVIQYESKCDCWEDKKDATLFHTTKYRIKSEPKYRAYTACEALQHCDKRIYLKNTDGSRTAYGFITSTRPLVVLVGTCSIAYEDLKEHYTFEDGSPCGVLIED